VDSVGRRAGSGPPERFGLSEAARALGGLPPALLAAGAGIALGAVAAVLLATGSIVLAALPFALLALLFRCCSRAISRCSA